MSKTRELVAAIREAAAAYDTLIAALRQYGWDVTADRAEQQKADLLATADSLEHKTAT